MTYDFDAPVQRRGTHSLKWDKAAPGELPMWVADMDFQTAPEIFKAINDRANKGIFGYAIVPDEWSEAVCGWWRRRHQFFIEKAWLSFSSGVIPTICSVIRRFTAIGEGVLVQTPVYPVFFNCIADNGRRIVESPLLYDGSSYSVDFDDLEKKLADPRTSLMLLCNPHNPIGKIWDAKTLERIGALCRKHHVLVLSDEIHCDLTDPGCRYVPFASVSAECASGSITCVAPTKAFNLAGLHSSAVIAPDPVLRHKVRDALRGDNAAEPNAFAVDAAIAAFTKGALWLDALRAYLAGNKEYARDFLAKELPQLAAVPSQATYLLWLDCGGISQDSAELAGYIRRQTGLWLSAGNAYKGGGDCFLRMNIACPRHLLEDGLNRLKQAVLPYMARGGSAGSEL